jgi:hypothetical protein
MTMITNSSSVPPLLKQLPPNLLKKQKPVLRQIQQHNLNLQQRHHQHLQQLIKRFRLRQFPQKKLHLQKLRITPMFPLGRKL